MKGYPTIFEKPQRRFMTFHRSETYRDAYWEPKYTGSKEYVLKGDEVQRDLKSIYRIVWNVSYRDKDGKVRKRQTHLANIRHWDVVWDFRESLQFRQGRIEGISPDGSGFLKRSFLAGEVPEIENAIQEFCAVIDERIWDALEKKVWNKDPEREPKGFDDALDKVNKKWQPFKETIVRDYIASEEFQVWLSNEAMRKEGPREPTEEELRDQKESEEGFENFKKAFGNRFKNSGSDGGGSTPNIPTPNNGSVSNPEIALEIIKAGFRNLARVYHPDAGGDDEAMRALIETKDELVQILS